MRADRLIGILLELDRKKKVSASKLAKKFEVSVRTIYRDIDVLSKEFPVVAETGPDGGYSLMPGYKLPPLPFSRKESAALTLMGRIANQNLGLMESKTFHRAYRKLISWIQSAGGISEKDISDKLLIDIEPWQTPPKVSGIVEKLKQAMADQKTVSFRYQKPNRKIEPQKMNPYGLCYRSGFIYLVGFSLKRNEIRVFRTDRFTRLKVTDEKFTPDPDFDLETFWTRDFPEEYETKGKPVTIIIDQSVSAEIKKTKWGGGNIRKLKNGKLELTFRTFDMNRLVSFVLRFGPKAELIEPENIRKKIAKELKEALKKYN